MHKIDCKCFYCKIRQGKYSSKDNAKFIDGRSLIQRTCVDCNKIITRQAIRCSSCAKKEFMQRVWSKRKRKLIKFCLDCKKILLNNRSTRCCDCFRKFQRGINHPNYIDGRKLNPYPLDFWKIRETIKNRDGYICQNCGMTEEEHLTILGYGVTVHHIDYNKTNNSNTNLITLCLWCNIRANKNRDYWLKYYTTKMETIQG